MKLNEATRQFIHKHADEDVRQLALRFSQASSRGEIDLPFALDQIYGRQTARRKLPSWAKVDNLVYPPHLSMEQCSSEHTALYKAQLLTRLLHGEANASLVDLTGGFGVDFSFMAKAANVVSATYVERNPQLCELVSHNLPLLGLPEVKVVCASAEDYLPQFAHKQGKRVVFLDPARRDLHGARTYALTDCTPNVLDMSDTLLNAADFVILKLSPMLDWRKAVADLGANRVGEVHIVSVANECKELLLVLRHNPDETALFCVNLQTEEPQFVLPSVSEPNLSNGKVEAKASSELSVSQPYASPMAGDYLYEPNASLMKAGFFTVLSQQYQVKPLAHDSHLFCSSLLVSDFPGRKFRIAAVSSMNKREWSNHLKDITRANIATRNFPMKPEELRRKLKLKEGGDCYIFGTTLASPDSASNLHVLLICYKA
ncbi:MAG: class I SAM-dependent methyltransferase [Prevotella sp.]|nr:class I SAM-dependent methyltransferase [Prevotella sp.]